MHRQYSIINVQKTKQVSWLWIYAPSCFLRLFNHRLLWKGKHNVGSVKDPMINLVPNSVLSFDYLNFGVLLDYFLFSIFRILRNITWLINNNSSTSFCASSSWRTDLPIHFQLSRPTTIWMFFSVTLTLSSSTFYYETHHRKCEITLGGWHCSLRLFNLGRSLHTGFQPWSLAWFACSTRQSATTYTTVVVWSNQNQINLHKSKIYHWSIHDTKGFDHWATTLFYPPPSET